MSRAGKNKKQISDVRKNMIKLAFEFARVIPKKNERAKLLIKDITNHLKKNRGSALDYYLYAHSFEELGETFPYSFFTFNQMLKLQKLKVKYDNKLEKVVIVRGK